MAVPSGHAELLAVATAALSAFGSRMSARLGPWNGRRQKQVALAAALGLSAYAGYRAYHSQRLSSTQQYVKRLGELLASAGNVSVDTLELAGQVAGDLKRFLASDGDDLPRSVRQLAKLLQSEEVQAAVKSTVGSAVEGASASLARAVPEGFAAELVEKVLAAFASDRGRSLVGLAVSVAARQSTSALCDHVQRMSDGSSAAGGAAGGASVGGRPAPPAAIGQLLETLTSGSGSAFLTLAISTMVRNAVSVYMDRTAGVNAYDELLAALSRPEYYSFVQSLTGSSISVFTREALATLLRGVAEAAQPPSPSTPGPTPIPVTHTVRITEAAPAADRDAAAAALATAPLAAAAAAVDVAADATGAQQHPATALFPSPLTPLHGAFPNSDAIALHDMGIGLGAGAGAGSAVPPSTPSEYTVHEPTGSVSGAGSAADAYSSSSGSSGDSAYAEMPISPSSMLGGPRTPAPLAEAPLQALAAAASRIAAHSAAAFQPAAAAAAFPTIPQPSHDAATAAAAAAALATTAAALPAAGGALMAGGNAGALLSTLAQAARTPELRSLALELTRTSASAAVGVVHSDPEIRAWFRAMLYRLYAVMAVLFAFAVYASGPRFLGY